MTRGPVLIVAPQPFFTPAGTPINVRRMCQALTEAGYEVHLVSLPHGSDAVMSGLVHRRTWRLPGVRGVSVGFSPTKLLYDILLAGLTLRLLLTRRFAVVHAIEEAAFFAVPLARLFGTGAIVDLDSDIAWQLQNHPARWVRALAGPTRWLRRLSLNHAACAITVAPALTRLVEASKPHIHVFEIHDIPAAESLIAPEPERVAALRADLGVTTAPIALYTGNFDRRQGLELLIQAFACVRAHHPAAQLLLVGGEPPEILRLKDLAATHGLKAGAIHFTGRRPPSEMPCFMALADVLVSPRLEPFVTPLKVYDYMASGRPIVATNLPTHTEVLGADAAILVPPTVAGLVEGLMRAFEQPEASNARARRARALVEERYNYEVFKGRLLKAYSVALGEAAGAAAPVAKTDEQYG